MQISPLPDIPLARIQSYDSNIAIRETGKLKENELSKSLLPGFREGKVFGLSLEKWVCPDFISVFIAFSKEPGREDLLDKCLLDRRMDG